MKPRTSDLRRYSYGGRLSDLTEVAVWKFDVVLPASNGQAEQRVTCYVKHATRGNAFQALFARLRQAKILGTGLPLTDAQAEIELGWRVDPGAVVVMHDFEEFGPREKSP